jgi:citrate lyase subunit beta/citryl-CoA lyase
MSKRLRPIRSLLFAPANRPELIAKFPRYPADAFAIDLEDGTPESEKDAARLALPGIVTSSRERNLKAQLFVRVNAPSSRHAQADLAAVLGLDVDGVILPKLETPAELEEIASRVSRKGRSLQVIGVIETARGAVNVETLAGAAGSVMTALAFGAEDFMTDLGGLRTPEGLEVLYARSRVVLAARAAGLQALDLVFVNIRDDVAFRRDAQMGRQLGYSGKMCIVPRQVEIVNEVFSPSPEEIDRARRLIAAYDSAQASGRGVFEFEGAMVDEPILKRARGILELSGD